MLLSFFTLSGLNKSILTQIWEIISRDGDELSPNAFSLGLRLISLAQNVLSPTLEVYQSMNEFQLPKFHENVSTTFSKPKSINNMTKPINSIGNLFRTSTQQPFQWTLSPNKKNEYMTYFQQLEDKQKKIPGNVASDLLKI